MSISIAADLIGQLVTNQTNRHENPSLLEKLRREAAHQGDGKRLSCEELKRDAAHHAMAVG